MATIGSLVVNLIANTSLFDSGMRKGQTGLKGFVASIDKTQRQVMGFAKAITAVAGMAGLTYLVKKTMDSIEATAQLSNRLGMATEDLISLQYAAEQSGMGTEEMNNALETFVRRIGEAQSGGGAAAKTLRELGLSAHQIASTDQTENLKMFADRINQLPTAAERAAVAYDLFGKKGQEMLNVLAGGSAGIEEARKRAEQLRITFSNFDAAKVKVAVDKLYDVKKILTAIAEKAVIELSPSIAAAAEKLIEFVIAGGDMRAKMIAGIKDVTIAFAYLGNGIKVIIGYLEGVAGIGATLATGFAGILSSIGLVSKEYVEGMADVANKLILDAGRVIEEQLPSEKVEAWFADLDKRSQSIKSELERAAQIAAGFPKLTFADIKITEGLQDMLDALEFEYDMLKKSNRERERAIKLLRFRNELDKAYNVKISGNLQGIGPQTEGWDKLTAVQQKAILLDQQYQDGLAKYEERMTGFDAFTSKMQDWAESASNVWANIGDVAAQALDGISAKLTELITTGKANFKEFAASVMSDLLQMMIRAQMVQILQNIPGIGGMFGGGAGAAGQSAAASQLSASATMLNTAGTVLNTSGTMLNSAGTMLNTSAISMNTAVALMNSSGPTLLSAAMMQQTSSALLNTAAVNLMAAATAQTAQNISAAAGAKGLVLKAGKLLPYATGGIIDRPTFFPMAKGNIGMMGEAGPEAIMPLTRGRDGRLGVSADGGSQPPVNVKIINVYDKKQMIDAIGTPDGEKKILNVLSRNKGIVKGMLN
ncbi:MAG: hypothetical protein JW749_03635 [Sedimentisphaerales bacterium]|nr:hypothetical protein [Sedimentisphaerales bacterium]